jgi:hypothetical protein
VLVDGVLEVHDGRVKVQIFAAKLALEEPLKGLQRRGVRQHISQRVGLRRHRRHGRRGQGSVCWAWRSSGGVESERSQFNERPSLRCRERGAVCRRMGVQGAGGCARGAAEGGASAQCCTRPRAGAAQRTADLTIQTSSVKVRHKND